MFDQTRPHPEWRVIVDFLSTQPYGTVLTHGVIAAQASLTPCSPRYYAQMRLAVKPLRKDWTRVLEPIRRTGYRVLLPNEHVSAMRRRQVIGTRRWKESIEIGLSTDTTHLAPPENAKLSDTLSKAGAMLSQLRSCLQRTRPGLAPGTTNETPKLLETT